MIRSNSIKKMLVIMIGLFLVGMTIIPMINAYTVKKNKNFQDFDERVVSTFASHHKVLVEFGTTTWCPHCPSMGYWLDQVSGDFQYIALVADMNGPANGRCSELGLSGYPTSFFDGGYTSVIGHQYSVTNLQNAYNNCQARTVADVDILLFATWNEGDTMTITAYVDNSGSSTYNGHLHVIVTEKTSRWLDYDGDPYKFAMLGYAFNTNIVVEPGGTWSDTVEGWSFAGITMDNIRLVATVFDQSTGYADETETAEPTAGDDDNGEVHPPLPKVQVTYPGEGELVNGTILITGNAHHPLSDGKLKWVMIKIDDGGWEEADGTVSWSYEWDSTTVEDGEHLIQAIASDGTSQSGTDFVYFLVNNYGNLAPDAPSTPSGSALANAGYTYTYSTSTTDPNDDDVRYGWDFTGDGNIDHWTEFYPSGTTVESEYSWRESGTYNVKVRAEDIYGEESIFSSDFPVTVTGTNEAPSIPVVNGPITILPEEEQTYTVSSTDPEGGEVYYLIQWGEGVDQGWFGPYGSGDEVTFSNSWLEKGDYEIKFKAKDIHDVESDWGILDVTVHKSTNIDTVFIRIITKLIEVFPSLELIFEPILINLFN